MGMAKKRGQLLTPFFILLASWVMPLHAREQGVVAITGSSAADLRGMAVEDIKPILEKQCPDEELYKESDEPTGKNHTCKGAWASYHAHVANKTLVYAWGAVAAVCATTCVASMLSPLGLIPGACFAGATAAGVADVALAKDFMSAMMGMGGMGAGAGLYGLSSLKPAGKEVVTQVAETLSPLDDDKARENATKKGTETADAKKTKHQTNKIACGTAALAAVLSYTKDDGAKKEKNSLATHLSQVAALQGASAATVGPAKAALSIDSTLGTPKFEKTKTTAAPQPQLAGACGQVEGGQATAQLALDCAVSNDPNLPGVNTPKFADEFQKTTGQPLGQFIANAGQSPGGAIGAAVESGIPGIKAGPLLAALGNMSDFKQPDSGSTYASGGSGGNKSGGGGPADGGIGDMMNNLMNAMGGKKKEDPDAGVKSVIFANQQRSPAQIAEDQTLIIFDRITYRYYYATIQHIYDDSLPTQDAQMRE